MPIMQDNVVNLVYWVACHISPEESLGVEGPSKGIRTVKLPGKGCLRFTQTGKSLYISGKYPMLATYGPFSETWTEKEISPVMLGVRAPKIRCRITSKVNTVVKAIKSRLLKDYFRVWDICAEYAVKEMRREERERQKLEKAA